MLNLETKTMCHLTSGIHRSTVFSSKWWWQWQWQWADGNDDDYDSHCEGFPWLLQKLTLADIKIGNEEKLKSASLLLTVFHGIIFFVMLPFFMKQKWCQQKLFSIKKVFSTDT